jgi:hypothetical protein
VTAQRPKRRPGFTLREHVAALAIFAAVTLAFFAPVLQGDTMLNVERRQRDIHPWAALGTGGEKPVVHYDLPNAFYPWQVFTSRALRDGELPFWDPYGFGGHPFFANGTSGVIYPLRVALALAVSPARGHDLLLLTHMFLAGAAMFWLLGAVRLSFSAALVGGLAWMANSFALSWQMLEHYTAVGVWLPIGVLLAHLVVRRRSWPAAFALALALGLLFFGGNVLFVELALVAIFGYGVTLAVVDALRDRTSLRGNAARLATSAGLFAGLSAVTSLSTLALAGDTARRSPSYGELGAFDLSLTSLFYVFFPPDFRAEPYHQNLFAGTAIGMLAIVGLGGRAALARFSAGLGVFAILFMLHTPVTYAATQVLPGLDGFKPLARAAFLLQFALAVLAAYGLETVRDVLGRVAGRVRPSAIAPALGAALVSIVAVSVVWQAYRLLDDLVPHQPADARLLFPSTPLIRHLQRTPDARFLATDPAFPGATATIHGLESAGGYDNLAPKRTENFWRVLGNGLSPDALESNRLIYAFYPQYELSQLRPELLARAGIQHVVTPPARARKGAIPPGLESTYEGADGSVFSVPGALPRAYVVGGCEVVATPSAALERFVADDFDATERMILEEPSVEQRSLCSDGGRAGQALVLGRSLNTLHIGVQAERAGWLVVTDTWDKGWRATVDGRAVDVLAANYVQRAVPVPAGSSSVRFTYQPVHFRYWAAISAVSFALTLGGLALLLVRRRRATGVVQVGTPPE